MFTLRTIAQAALICLALLNTRIAIAQQPAEAAKQCVPRKRTLHASQQVHVEMFARLVPVGDSAAAPAIYLGTLLQEVQLAFTPPEMIGKLEDGVMSVWLDGDGRKPALQKPINVGPTYPTHLRESGVSGEVLALFVVDQDGQAEMRTLRVLKSSHADFTRAVRDFLPRMRFSPAELDGCKVRQVVQLPFAFKLNW